MRQKLKNCKRCNRTFPIEQFGNKGLTPSGSIHRSVYCVDCFKIARSEYNKEYSARHHDKKIAYLRAYYAEHRSPDVDKRKQQFTAREGFKVCRTCLYEIPITRFHKHARSTDGLKSECVSCRIKKDKPAQRRRYRSAIRKGICAQCRKRPLATKAFCRECNNRILKINHERRASLIAKGLCSSCGLSPARKGYRLCITCGDKRRVKSKLLYHQTKDRNREAMREWRFKAKARRRKQIQSIGNFEEIDRRVVIARDRSTCYICNQIVPRNRIHLDHVIPISRGGSHTYDNVRVTCKDCNLRKGTKLPEEIGITLQPLPH